MCHHDEIPCWMSKHPPLRRDVRPGGSGSTLARLAEVQYDSSYVAALNLIQVKCPKLIRNDKRVEVTQRTLIKRVGMSTLCQKRTFDSYSITAWDKKDILRTRADVRFTAQSGHYAQLGPVHCSLHCTLPRTIECPLSWWLYYIEPVWQFVGRAVRWCMSRKDVTAALDRRDEAGGDLIVVHTRGQGINRGLPLRMMNFLCDPIVSNDPCVVLC